MSQQMPRVKAKTGFQLAHDALHGIVNQAIPPILRPPPAQFFMIEAEFKRLILPKPADAKEKDSNGADANEGIAKDGNSKAISRKGILLKGTTKKKNTPIHTVRFANPPLYQNIFSPATDGISRQVLSVEGSLGLPLIRPKLSPLPLPPLQSSRSRPRIASFPGRRPSTPPIFKKRGGRKTYNYIPPSHSWRSFKSCTMPH